MKLKYILLLHLNLVCAGKTQITQSNIPGLSTISQNNRMKTTDVGPFHEKGIPAAYFVTTNSYAHLHYMTDTPETLNQTLFEKITKLAFLTALEVANGDYHREEIIK